jgi:PAS domain S-box-containing protein
MTRSLAEKALLTYQAMTLSDDVIILMERMDGAPTADTLIIGANDAFRRASGYSNDQILGRKVTDLFPLGNQSDGFRDAIRNTRSLRAELACLRADGTTFVLGFHLMPAPARSSGKPFVIIGRDITDILRDRQTQNSLQRLLAQVFFSVGEAMSIVDSEGGMVMTNPAFDRLLGYKPNALVGRKSLDLVAPESRVPVAALIKQQIADKQEMTYTTSMFRADGSNLIVRITSVLVPVDQKQFRIVTLRPNDKAGTTDMRTASAGRINLIGLDEVRAALGDRWRAVAARAMESAEVVLKRRCGPQDSYSRAGDTSFVVCFGGVSEREASFRAAMIGREIRDRLIGQGENPDTAFVRAIAAAVRLPAKKDYGSPEKLHAALLDDMDKQLVRLEEEARQTLLAGWANSVSELQPVLARDLRQTIANQVCLPAEVEQRLTIALSVLPRKESQAFDLDALLLGLAARQAISTMGQGILLPLLVNVRFDVFFTSASIERFLVSCRKIDPRVSSRLVLMLSSLPPGLPKSRLLECVTRLRSFCCAVGYHAGDLAAAETIDLSNSFNPIVAIPFDALSAKESDRLKQTIASLQARRAKVLIHKVATERNAAALRSLGADMIAMDAI